MHSPSTRSGGLHEARPHVQASIFLRAYQIDVESEMEGAREATPAAIEPNSQDCRLRSLPCVEEVTRMSHLVRQRMRWRDPLPGYSGMCGLLLAEIAVSQSVSRLMWKNPVKG